MDDKLNLYQRINKIREEAPIIGKDAQVQNYKAVTHDKVTRSIRDLMTKYGVCSAVSLVSDAIMSTGLATRSGRMMYQYQAIYDCTLINADDPQETVVMRISAHADDAGDKAPGKAISYATKTFYLKAFALETGENDESRIDESQCSKATQWITKDEANEIKTLLDAAVVMRDEKGELDSYEGVDEFCAAWLPLSENAKLEFGSVWIPEFYPRAVTKAKDHMRDVVRAYRQSRPNNSPRGLANGDE